jgi:hypothetical protein
MEKRVPDDVYHEMVNDLFRFHRKCSGVIDWTYTTYSDAAETAKKIKAAYSKYGDDSGSYITDILSPWLEIYHSKATGHLDTNIAPDHDTENAMFSDTVSFIKRFDAVKPVDDDVITSMLNEAENIVDEYVKYTRDVDKWYMCDMLMPHIRIISRRT